MDALSALGLAYNDDDDDSDEEGEEHAMQKSVPARPSACTSAGGSTQTSAAMESSSLNALPDAADLGLPGEDDWRADDANDVDATPAYDRVGTRYNAVALPSSMASEAETFNNRTGRQNTSSGSTGSASVKAAVASALGAADAISTTSSSSSSSTTNRSAGKPLRNRGVMLPPQLRRPNVTTEELSSMRTAKRHKPQ